MKKSYTAAVILLLLFSIRAFAQNTQQTISLSLLSPSPYRTLELTGKPFYLIGMVKPAGAKLSVNGMNAKVDDDGAFIAFANVDLFSKDTKIKGRFIFDITTPFGKKKIEKIFNVIPLTKTSPSDTLVVDSTWNIDPSVDKALQIGDYLPVEIKATPNSNVSFKVSGIDKIFPMSETKNINNYIWGDAVFGEGFKGIHDTVKGIYKGGFFLTKQLKNDSIKFIVTNKKLGEIIKWAPGKISTMEPSVPLIIQTKYDPNLITGRYGPGKGYKLFLADSINLLVTGRQDGWYRCKISSDESIFIPESSVEELPEGTPLPHSSIRVIRTKDFAKYTIVRLGLNERCPYKIIEHNNPQSIEMLVYNVTSNIDWIFYDKKGDFIKQIKWDQPKDNVLKVKIILNEKTHWGYSASYEGNILDLKIKKPAKRNAGFLFWNNQLKGRVITLDPGHNPDTGAEGPRGTLERDVNLKITLQLKKLLEDSGAKVHLTHTDNPLSLRQRKPVVNSFDPDISISIHNNAVPQGVNPIIHNGSSVYYYYGQALPLAEMVQENFLKNLGLKDFGLYWDNLYMCRIPGSISLLVEPAFMIVPEQEKLLNTEKFREKIAKSIFDGIEEFYEEYSQ